MSEKASVEFTLESLGPYLNEDGLSLPDRSFTSTQPLPFQEAYRPLLAWIHEEIPNQKLPFETSETSGRGLLSGLHHELAFLGQLVLYREFSKRRSAAREKELRLMGTSKSPGDELYREFVLDLHRGGWRDLLGDHGGLLHLFAVRMEFWREFLAKFIDRFQADRDRLVERFFPEGNPGSPVGFDSTAVAFQRGKTRRITVYFDSGQQLWYRPDGARTADLLAQFTGWINNDLTRELPVRRGLTRTGYGWWKGVEPRSCETEADVEDYFFRVGGHLAVLYALNGSLLDGESLVARGPDPYLTDWDGLFRTGGNEPCTENPLLDEGPSVLRERTVSRTGLLPGWQILGPDRQTLETGGLRSGTGEPTLERKHWVALNTDEMHRRKGEVRPPDFHRSNRVLLNGESQSVKEYVDDVVDGFKGAYGAILSRSKEIREEWLPDFSGCTVRYQLRSARVYRDLFREVLEPGNLSGSVEFQQSLADALKDRRTLDHYFSSCRLESLELEQLGNGVLPEFKIDSHGTQFSLQNHGEVVCSIDKSGLDRCRETLRAMDREDRDFQVSIIRRALEDRGGRSQPSTPGDDTSTARAGGSPPEVHEILDRICGQLMNQSLEDPEGALNWYRYRATDRVDHIYFHSLADDFYRGRAGIAFFLASLDRVRGETGYRPVVDRIMGEIWDRTKRAGRGENPARRAGMMGIGGLIYTFRYTGEFYDDSSYVEQAIQLVRSLSQVDPEQDEMYDLLLGSAGTLLALLSLYDRTGSSRVLDEARALGTYLVRKQETRGDQKGGWDTIGAYPLTGLAHGASGIALALFRLYRETGVEDFLEAARSGLAFERRWFDEDRGNWPDFRDHHPVESEGKAPCSVRWCAGAPGIVLSRLQLRKHLDDARLGDEIRAGVRTTLRKGAKWNLDELCCGHMGRFEILRQAREGGFSPESGFDLDSKWQGFLERFTREGRIRSSDLEDNRYEDPSLMKGLSGVGYALLRWKHPERLPDVLTLE